MFPYLWNRDINHFFQIPIKSKAKSNPSDKVTSRSTLILFSVVFYTNWRIFLRSHKCIFFFFFSEENQSKKFLSRVPLHLFGHNWIICHFLKQYLQEISFYQLWFTTWDRSLESLLTKDRVVQRKVYIWTKLGFDVKEERREWLFRKQSMVPATVTQHLFLSLTFWSYPSHMLR